MKILLLLAALFVTSGSTPPQYAHPTWKPNPHDKIVFIEENMKYALAVDMSSIKSLHDVKTATVIVLFNTKNSEAPSIAAVVSDMGFDCKAGTAVMSNRMLLDSQNGIIKYENLHNTAMKPVSEVGKEVMDLVCHGFIPIKPYLGPTPWNPTDPAPMQSAA